jgi:hypothetical protein
MKHVSIRICKRTTAQKKDAHKITTADILERDKRIMAENEVQR